MLDYQRGGRHLRRPRPAEGVEALKKANRPAGVLLVVLNDAGDVLSANLAWRWPRKQGLRRPHVADARRHRPRRTAPAADRRGLVGCIPLYKIAGAAAEAGLDLDEVYALAERFNPNMATLAVAMKTATHPGTGQLIFDYPTTRWRSAWASTAKPAPAPGSCSRRRATARIMLDRLVAAISAPATACC